MTGSTSTTVPAKKSLFTTYSKTIEDGDLVIAYVNPLDMSAMTVRRGATLTNKYGAFPHDNVIGQPFGVRIASTKGTGHITFLHPTPELWTQTLPHRTQILYMPDIALVSQMLDLKPGRVVVESGTGSGSFSHSIARTIAPSGKLYTFEYHAERVAKFQEELLAHGVPEELVLCTHRDVCKKGFDLDGVADAVFLDLPSPWEAIASAKNALKRGRVGRLCSFSPAIEQVQKTCTELEKNGFYDIRMFETLIRKQEVKTIVRRHLPTRDALTGENAGDGENGDAEDGGDAVNPEDQVIVSRTLAKVAGHTSFLVFASVLPLDGALNGAEEEAMAS
ncbi:tRNA methyltransferase complex GCD14 subunit-domain-containing protein [Chytriomyces sp. MP71]|nr:tRNA methyltransferase complex GCD14 subunit-domain-containing protein [Chytriomyces sp. MP71]